MVLSDYFNEELRWNQTGKSCTCIAVRPAAIERKSAWPMIHMMVKPANAIRAALRSRSNGTAV